MRDISLLQLALSLAPPWTVTGSDFDAEARRLDHPPRLHRRQSLYLPGLRCGRLPGARHRTDDVATSQLLPAPSSICMARVPRVHCVRCGVKKISVPKAQGARGWRLHPAIRGVGHGLGFSNAGQRCGPTGGVSTTPGYGASFTITSNAPERSLTDLDAGRHASGDRREAARRGHHYRISLFVDIDRARVIFATRGARTPRPSRRLPMTSRRTAAIPMPSPRSASTFEPGVHQGHRRQPGQRCHHLRQIP